MSQKISLYKSSCKKFNNQPKNSTLIMTDFNKFTSLSHLKPGSTHINNYKNKQHKKKSNSMTSINYKIKKINALSNKKRTNPLLSSTINKPKLNKKNTKCDSNSINNLIDINISVNYKNISLNENKFKKILSSSNTHTKNDINNNTNNNNININNINNIHNIYDNSSFFNNTINNSVTNKCKNISNPFIKNEENFFGGTYPKNKNRKANVTNQVSKNNGNYTISSLDESQNKTQINNKIKCLSCKNIYSTPVYMNSLSNVSNNNEAKNDIYTMLRTNMNKKLNKLFLQKSSNTISKNNEILDNIFSILKSTFYKFGNLCENQSQKDLVSDIISAMTQYKKMQIIQANNYEKESEELIKKSRELIKENLKFKQQNIMINNKFNLMQKELEELKKKLKNNKNKNINGSYFENYNEYIDEGNSKSKNSSPTSSYVNTDELESIRFFDKIVMKKHSFSKSKIPELSLEKIKLNNMYGLNNNGNM